MKHPAIASLAIAQSRYRIAVEECPHWDYDEYPDGAQHRCCEELRASAAALRKLKRRAKAESVTT